MPLWVALFCYSTVVGLLFQKLLLPSIPSLHAGHGLMGADAIYFHQVAEAMAAQIQLSGWSWDALWSSSPGARGNVTVLAALYALFGSDPSLVLPINAAFHATSGVLLYLIIQCLWAGQVGQIAGVISAILFACFPSSLNWYAQVHKDGYAITATFLVLYSWLQFLNQPISQKGIIKFVVSGLIAIALLLFVRPYNTLFLTAATGIWLIAVAGLCVVRKTWRATRSYLFIATCLWLFFALMATFIGMKSSSEINAYDHWSTENSAEDCPKWVWQPNSAIPSGIEKLAQKAARTRAGLLCAHYNARSNIDQNRQPNTTIGVIAYMPRALAIALLGPFPDMWFDSKSMARLVGAVEISIWYCLIFGFVFALFKLRSDRLMLCLGFALCYLAIYGFTIGNMGTLHRLRYPFLFIFMGVGVLGWVYALSKNNFFKTRIAPYFAHKPTVHVPADALLSSKESDKKSKELGALRKKAVGGGMLVSLITLLSFIGFFFRDVIMANTFRFGSQIDAFYIAMLIPMFFVNVFGQSFGSTSVSVYMHERQHSEKQGAAVAQYLAYKVTLFLLALSVILAILAPVLVSLLGWKFSAETRELTQSLFYQALPLLVFSGMIILGNAILSARMNFTAPAWSQAVVPVTAILFLLLAGERWGIFAALLGMIVGQLLNLLLVQFCLKREQLSVVPKRTSGFAGISNRYKKQFASLVLTSIFLQISLLVDNGMAATLQPGSVAVLGVGYKVIFFVTGVIGTGISMALLPYFVGFVVKRDMVSANRELSLLVSLATLLGIAASLIIYYAAPPLMPLFFAEGKVNAGDIDTVIRVIHMGILQVPFFACQLILIKYATASHDNRAILVASIVGMLVNIVLNYLLMQRMGVAGISAATTLSMFCSAAVLLWMVHRQGNMSWLDVFFSGVIWLLFLTMMLCLHFQSYSGVIVSGIAMVLATYILNSEKLAALE